MHRRNRHNRKNRIGTFKVLAICPVRMTGAFLDSARRWNEAYWMYAERRERVRIANLWYKTVYPLVC